MSETVERIERILEPIVASLGLVLWDVLYRREGPAWMLRVYIDRAGSGVSLDDCETVSRDLSAALDVEDFLQHAYTLEVSSPGLDRSLTKPFHFEWCIGKVVKIKTYQPIDGQKVFRGPLAGMGDGRITLATETGERTFPLDAVASAALEVII